MPKKIEEPAKAWTKPVLAPLGTLQDVRASQNVLVQTGNSKT